jgi:hypothetical protein
VRSIRDCGRSARNATDGQHGGAINQALMLTCAVIGGVVVPSSTQIR